MKKLSLWFLKHGIFSVLLYAAYGLGKEGAESVVMLFVWACMLGKYLDNKKTKRSRSAPHYITVPYGLFVVGVFVWHGAWLTGICWLFYIVSIEAMWDGKELDSKGGNADEW